MDSKNISKGSVNKNKCSDTKVAKEEQSIGLDRFSYADFVVLSSTLAFAIAEELNDSDTALLIAFLSMLNSDLVMLRTQEGIRVAKEQRLSQAQEDEELDLIDTADITDIIGSLVDDSTIGTLIREPKKKKIKKKTVKKRK